MYIKDRKKIEKALANLINETADQLLAAREYEIRQICEEVALQYSMIKKPI